MLDRTTLVRATCVRLLHTAAFVAGLVAASNAMAHQYWLTAADLRPQRGDAVEIGARAGVGFAGEAKQATPSPGRERYRRCAKLWFAGTSDLIARRAIGLPLEIVPTTPPGDAAPRCACEYSGTGGRLRAPCSRRGGSLGRMRVGRGR